MLVTGQAQGIGQALFEYTVYEPGTGQLLSGSLMDYALLRADNLPSFDIALVELPTSANPLGVKGSGQAGCIAAPQTIINAIVDALARSASTTSTCRPHRSASGARSAPLVLRSRHRIHPLSHDRTCSGHPRNTDTDGATSMDARHEAGYDR